MARSGGLARRAGGGLMKANLVQGAKELGAGLVIGGGSALGAQYALSMTTWTPYTQGLVQGVGGTLLGAMVMMWAPAVGAGIGIGNGVVGMATGLANYRRRAAMTPAQLALDNLTAAQKAQIVADVTSLQTIAASAAAPRGILNTNSSDSASMNTIATLTAQARTALADIASVLVPAMGAPAAKLYIDQYINSLNLPTLLEGAATPANVTLLEPTTVQAAMGVPGLAPGQLPAGVRATTPAACPPGARPAHPMAALLAQVR